MCDHSWLKKIIQQIMIKMIDEKKDQHKEVLFYCWKTIRNEQILCNVTRVGIINNTFHGISWCK